MKKQFFLLSALALTSLVSCGGSKPSSSFKVGLICLHDLQSTYDKNFITAFEASAKEAKSKGLIGEYRIIDNIPEGEECYTAAEQLVNDGFGAIFTDSFGHDKWAHIAAAEFPNVFFSSATGIEAKTSNLPNFHNAFASIYEGRYLAGVAAGQYLVEHEKVQNGAPTKVGYVGAWPYAEVISGFTSWFLGVRSVVPNAEMVVTYTNSWYDENGEKVAAENLIKEGCVLISQHADSMGAPGACRDHKPNPIPNVSYNVNTVEMDPQCKDTYVAHSRINWKPYYDKAIEAAVKGPNTVVDGEVEQNWTGTIGTGSVEYNVSNLVQNKKPIEDAKAKLLDGSLKVFDCKKFAVNDLESKASYFEFPPKKDVDYKMDGDGHLTSLIGDTTEDYVRDKELVKTEGDTTYIQESVFRSAPSFDIIIDGITYLNK